MQSPAPESLRIAVLIPARNAEAYVCDALESVAAQTRPPDELIVVDDGSADRTAAGVRAWSARRGVAVELLHQTPGGAASARNRGLRATQADLVALLDADDLFLPRHLERAEQAFLRQPELVLCFADVDVLWECGGACPSFLADKPLQSLATERGPDDLRLISASPYTSLISGNYIPVSTSVYRVEALRAIDFFDAGLINAADRDLNLRLSRRGPFAYYPMLGGRKRQRRDGLSRVDGLQAQRDRFRVLEKMLEQRGPLTLSHEEITRTREGLAREARALLYSASCRGLRSYGQSVLFLARKRILGPVCNPKALLRAIAYSTGVMP